MPEPSPFIRITIRDLAGSTMVITQQNPDADDLEVRTSERVLRVKRADLQLALLAITEEG